MRVCSTGVSPILVLVCALLATTSVGFAQPCATRVTKTIGSAAGSLNFLAATGCSPIQFDAALSGKTIIVPETVTLKLNVRVDGNDLTKPVTITATDTKVKSIFTLAGNDLLDRLIIQPVKNAAAPNAIAVSMLPNQATGTKGNNNTIRNCTIQSGPNGLVVDTGVSNTFTRNSFTGLTDNPIRLVNKGNHDFPAPTALAAVQIDAHNWTLTGDAAIGTEQVEIYQTDDPNLPVQGKTYLTTSTKFINDGQFTMTFGLDELDPGTRLTTLAIGDTGDTSTFSDAFVPNADMPAFTAIVDPDQDGHFNWEDNCPNEANPNQFDSDGDGVGEVCDNCPSINWADQSDHDGDTQGDACDIDIDGDGVPNFGSKDNCPFDSNPQQEDTDHDGLGDACEQDANNDDDGDGAIDSQDNCPTIKNLQQEDSDADLIGNACDEDIDNDGIKNPPDNCPFAVNQDQKDADGDGLGDACEAAPAVIDTDGDGIPDDQEVDPDLSGNTTDQDADGLSDSIDNCPTVFNTTQADPDGDLQGNECDVDDDGDGFADVIEGLQDLDNDGLPNSLDTDSDGDGTPDAASLLDADANGVPDYLQPELALAATSGGGGCSLVTQ